MVTATDSTRGLRTLTQAYTAVIDAIERDLEETAGLPLTWFDVLLTLGEHEGSLRMQELAGEAGLTKSGITRLVDRLEREGLVARDECSDDKRVCFAVLTDAGRRKLEQAWPHFARSVDQHFARHLKASEAERLEAALTKLLTPDGRDASNDRAGGTG